MKNTRAVLLFLYALFICTAGAYAQTNIFNVLQESTNGYRADRHGLCFAGCKTGPHHWASV